MKLQFKIVKDHIRPAWIGINPVSDSVNHLTAAFDFESEWENATKTAIFSSGENTYHVILENDRCVIPWEALNGNSFDVSVFGIDGDKKITATKITLPLSQSGYANGDEPKEPTQPIYEQLLSAYEIAKKLNDGSTEIPLLINWDNNGETISLDAALKSIVSDINKTTANMSNHKANEVLDHPDKCVTLPKLADDVTEHISNEITATKTELDEIISTKANKTDIDELQDTKTDKTQYASISQAGLIKLHSGSGVNRSGLVVYEDGSAVVNTKTERGITRDGVGQIGINPATAEEVKAKTEHYKPIAPDNIDTAVQAATVQDISGVQENEALPASCAAIKRYIETIYGGTWVEGEPSITDDIIRLSAENHNLSETKADAVTIIKNDIDTMLDVELAHNTETRMSMAVSELVLLLPTEIPDDYISSAVFTTGTAAPNFIYPDTIKMQGEDCINGVFIPIENKRYTLIVSYDGVYTTGVVGGFAI